MKCGRHSSIRTWGSPVLAVALGAVGWALAVGPARAEGDARAVAICCAWGNRLSDGVLTYSVSGDDATALSIVRSAIQAWDDALPELTLTEVPPGGKKRSAKADISIVYGPGTADGGETPHATPPPPPSPWCNKKPAGPPIPGKWVKTAGRPKPASASQSAC